MVPGTQISRRDFLAGSAAAMLAPPRAPNLVIVSADGWRGSAMPAAGDLNLRAPNVERLAGESIVCTRAYTAETASDPEHAAILTGSFPHRADAAPALAPQLQDAGYAIASPPQRAGAGWAADFIRHHGTDPFFLYLRWPVPGAPAPSFRKLYQYARISVRANVPDAAEAEARAAGRTYYAGLAEIDAALGDLLNALEETDVARDTIVVFTSAHGVMLRSHGIEGSDEPYEEVIWVPLLLRYPRAAGRGRTEEGLISLVDLPPTLLALCGADVPGGLQGRDLSKILLSGAGERPESVFVEGGLGTPDAWRAVIRGADKIVVNSRIEVEHIFNLALDPYEMEDLAPAHTRTLQGAELKAIVRDWMTRTGDWATRTR